MPRSGLFFRLVGGRPVFAGRCPAGTSPSVVGSSGNGRWSPFARAVEGARTSPRLMRCPARASGPVRPTIPTHGTIAAAPKGSAPGGGGWTPPLSRTPVPPWARSTVSQLVLLSKTCIAALNGGVRAPVALVAKRPAH